MSERVWHQRKVGELYHPNRTAWPETFELRLMRSGCELVGFYNRPRQTEIEAWRHGKFKFGWCDIGPAALLVFDVGGLGYCSASFHPMHQKPEDRGLPRPEDEKPLSTIEHLASTPLDLGDGLDMIVIGATDSTLKGHYESSGGHLMLYMTLVDAMNGKIAALRMTTWPPSFVRRVASTVERMMVEPFDPNEERDVLSSTLRRFSDRELYMSASQARCVGGADE